jgi:hypothetical protein
MIRASWKVFIAFLVAAAAPAARAEFYEVGPGKRYANLRDVPWLKLRPGDVVRVAWRAEPYRDKIHLSVRGQPGRPIVIEGVPAGEGRQPVIDARGAAENPQAKYFSSQIANQGVFTVAPRGDEGAGYKPGWIEIRQLTITGARREHGLTRAGGARAAWNAAAAAVALYRCEHVTIAGCQISDCENGIFGKSYGNEAGNLRGITVSWCDISGCGVPGKDRCHNTYVEGIGTVYQFNRYGPPAEGSAGCNLKDRSAGTVIRFNRLEGGARLLDLVEPDDGGRSFVEDPQFGHAYVYGNFLVNPAVGGAAAIIHFGFDGTPANAAKTLHFYHNTVVNVNDRDAGGRWRTSVFKCDLAGQKVVAENNIFHSLSPATGHWSGDWNLAYGKGAYHLGVNWVSSWYKPGSAEIEMRGREDLLTGADPGFADAAAGDCSLRADSPCVGKARTADREAAAKYPADHFWDGKTWVPGTGNPNLGAAK